MTIVAVARAAALVCLAAAVSGCGRTSSSASAAASPQAAGPLWTSAAATATPGSAMGSMQNELARITAERDEARAQLARALARERTLQAELARYRAAVAAPEAPVPQQSPVSAGEHVFKSVSTQPTP